MTDHPPKIPPVERPQTQPQEEAALDRLEGETLDKLARSSRFSAAFEHDQHMRALNRRIGVLQAKLDERERELHIALPRISELEQAARTSRVGAIVETIGVGGGALLLSVASFAPLTDWRRLLLIGAGIAASLMGLFGKALFAIFGWPPKRAGN